MVSSTPSKTQATQEITDGSRCWRQPADREMPGLDLAAASGTLVPSQFLRLPSCSIVRAFSTLSVPDAWLGGYSLNVARNSPTMVTAGTIVHSFSPHQR